MRTISIFLMMRDQTEHTDTTTPKLYHWEDGLFKKEIHMSHLTTYLRCPQQMYQKYVRGQTKKQSDVNLSTGSVHHGFLKDQLRRKRDGQPLLDDNQIADTVSDMVKDEADNLDMEQSEELKRSKDAIIEQAKVLNSDYIQHVEPVFVEREFRIKFPGMEYVLAGRIDNLRKPAPEPYEDAYGNTVDEGKVENKTYSVDDLKSSGSSPAKNEFFGYDPKPEHWLQHAGYSLGAWVAMGGKASDYQQTLNRTVYLVKNKTPVVKPASYLITKNEIRFMYSLLQSMERSLKSGLFPPNPIGWWCNKQRCPAFDQCRGKELVPFEQLFFDESNES